MCGRYSETVDPMELTAVLSIELCTYEFTPRPMIAPTQMAPVIPVSYTHLTLPTKA